MSVGWHSRHRGGLARRLAVALLAGLLLPAAAAYGQAGLAAHDSSLPIEISADRLTVEQASRQALFTGNVEAVQGDMTLRADELVVAYDLEAGGDAGQAIRRIEARGNVVIASPEETARAQRAVYDVPAGRIVLEEQVVLVRGEDVVEGARLEIDLGSERAVMTAAGTTRVRALFHPADGTAGAGAGQ